MARALGSIARGQAPGTGDDLSPARRGPVPAFAGRRRVRVLDGTPDRGGTTGSALPAHLVSRASEHLSERHPGLDPGRHDGDVPNPDRIVVDVSSHKLFLYKRGRLVLSTPVAVGKSSTPTPRGRFYITQRFVLTNPNGPYGARALGISAFSDVLRSWRDGGPVGIHGTNEPFSIGRPVSHGCVRLPEHAMLDVFRQVPLATPVIIRN